jgi:hypothetical protein
MREFLELRIDGKLARRNFPENEIISLGGGRNEIKRLAIEVGSASYEKAIALLENKKRRNKWPFLKYFSHEPSFYILYYFRTYTNEEITAAKLFKFASTAYFEPCGEDCGTQYDEAAGCSICGANAPRIGPLYLKNSTIPRGKDFAITIGRENLISHRAAELFDTNQVTGIEYGSVMLKTRQGEIQSSNWYELIINNASAMISDKTVTGIEPFDLDVEREYVCKNGDTIGLNILSELFIKTNTLPTTDFALTTQFIGGRKGKTVIPPHREILISPRVFHLAQAHKLKGWEFEVVHLV